MNYDMTNEEMAHYFAARYGNHDKYEDLYQEAWVAILEAEDKGLDRKGVYWHVKPHVSRYYNYRDRVVPLPPRGGSKSLLEGHEIEYDIKDYMSISPDHAEAYELKREVDFMQENINKLPLQDVQVLHDIYNRGKSYRDLAKDRGYNKDWWQKYHTQLLNKLKHRQEGN